MAKLKFTPKSVEVSLSKETAVVDTSSVKVDNDNEVQMIPALEFDNYVTKEEVNDHLKIYRNVISDMTTSMAELNKRIVETNDKVENYTCNCSCKSLEEIKEALDHKCEVLEPKVEMVTIHKDHDAEIKDLQEQIKELSLRKDKVVEVKYNKSKTQKLINIMLTVSVACLILTHFI